ncbi:WXG100 family type VII secretion target [Microbacterium sp.]|uniref:WXG100 family type VII secretion target n=1 Tax=Microbacterium sp. TaxID=51671 RepID=UPI0039E5B053
MRADFEALASEANRLDAVADRLEDRVEAARVRAEDLLASGWTGESSSSFRTAHEQWEAYARENISTLRHLVDGLRGATADMLAHEQAIMNDTRSLGAVLPIIDVAAEVGDR